MRKGYFRRGWAFHGVFLSLLFISQVYGEELRLSLEDAFQRAERSASFLAADAQLQIMAENTEISKSSFLPRLSLSHGVTYSNDPVYVFSSKLQQRRFSATDFAIPQLNDPSGVWHQRMRAELMQPVFEGLTRFHNLGASRLEKKSMEEEISFRKSVLRKELTQLYWSAIAFEKSEEIYKEGIDRLLRLERSYQLMDAPTSASTTNYLVTQSLRHQLEARYQSIQTAKENQINALKAKAEIQKDAQVTFIDAFWSLERIQDFVQTQSAKARTDVEAALYQVKAFQEKEEAIKGSFWPKLHAIAGVNVFTGNFSDLDTSYDVGVLLSWDIFDPSRYARIRRARVESRWSDYFYRSISSQSEVDSENSTRALESKIRELSFMARATEKAQEALRVARLRYEQGTLPLFDYSQAIQNWVYAEEGMIALRKSLMDAVFDVKFQRGSL